MSSLDGAIVLLLGKSSISSVTAGIPVLDNGYQWSRDREKSDIFVRNVRSSRVVESKD